jgi:hypothetical protein
MEVKEMTETKPNYVVVTRSFKGTERTECETEEEVWNAIGNMSFGGIYDVHSPVGLSTDAFIPF